MFRFLKGMTIGLTLGAMAGAVAGLTVTPHQRRKILRSSPCRTLRHVCCKIENMM